MLVEIARSHTDGQGIYRFLDEFVEHGAGNRALAEALIRGGVDVEAELGAQSEALTRAVAELLRVAQQAGTARTDITPDDVLAPLGAIHLCRRTCCTRPVRVRRARRTTRRAAPAAHHRSITARHVTRVSSARVPSSWTPRLASGDVELRRHRWHQAISSQK